mgnify:CR=1 FL=1
MELTVGDLVLHTNNEKMGYGLVLSPTVMAHGTWVCTVQWIITGYKHNIDISYLEKINSDKK